MKSIPIIPASFFGTVLGVMGLGTCWRVAAKLWGLPPLVGEGILALGSAIWGVLIVLYIAKWVWLRAEALDEAGHPVFCCYIGLVPLTGVLVATAIAPYQHALGVGLFLLGAAGQLAFGLYRTGQLWTGGREHTATTPALYLPSVAGSLVTCIGANALGFQEIAPLFFGVGLFSWLSIESVILQRLLTVEMMPKAQRLTLGIHLAPAVTACVAYLGFAPGRPDFFAQFLLGYGLFQFAQLVRMVGWLREEPFGPGYWAFSFGITALPLSLMAFVQRGMAGPYPILAGACFIWANLFVGGLLIASFAGLVRGTYLPARVVKPA